MEPVDVVGATALGVPTKAPLSEVTTKQMKHFDGLQLHDDFALLFGVGQLLVKDLVMFLQLRHKLCVDISGFCVTCLEHSLPDNGKVEQHLVRQLPFLWSNLVQSTLTTQVGCGDHVF